MSGTSERMKIVAGIGTVDDYPLYIEAGADELFAGFIPQHWMNAQGRYHALNRREVMYVNVQVGSRSELGILADMVREMGKPVTIAMNSLVYGAEQYKEICRIVEECMEMGFDSFIVADPILLWELEKLPKDKKEKIKIHISGECGEVNSRMIQEFEDAKVKRFIFHRKTSIADMKQLIRKNENISCQFEAFAMNELCHYNGSFCNSLHCDEFAPACRLPYRLQNGSAYTEEEEREINVCLPGYTGCGLCALYRLREAGVGHLKIVGRGNYTQDMIRDIKAVKQALDILEGCETEEGYLSQMKKQIFPEGCSGNCYYRT